MTVTNEQAAAAPSPTEVIKMVLLALQRGEEAIGTQAAPTRAQVEHWQRHVGPWGFQPRCAFCRSAASRSDKKERKASWVKSEKKLGGGVVVRRIAAGATKAKIEGKEKGRASREARKAAPEAMSKGSSRDLGF